MDVEEKFSKMEEKLDRLTKAVEQIGIATKRAGLTESQRNTLDHMCFHTLRYGRADHVQFFLEQGALTFKEERGDYRTLFSYACELGRFEVVKVFANLGLMDKYRGDNGKTPLDYAVQRKHVDIIQFLERHPSY